MAHNGEDCHNLLSIGIWGSGPQNQWPLGLHMTRADSRQQSSRIQIRGPKVGQQAPEQTYEQPNLAAGVEIQVVPPPGLTGAFYHHAPDPEHSELVALG